jgi:transposase InsO family protein
VFEDGELDYNTAMRAFVAASQETRSSTSPTGIENDEKTSHKAQKRALRQEEEQLRTTRRGIRQQRKQEDVAWRVLRGKRRCEQANLSTVERRAQDEWWRALRQQRWATLEQRKQEDETWRQARHSLRERQSILPLVTAWIAILVITDNCTRQCLGLPLFVAGSKVTAQLVVEALRVLLPPELQFLITDRGIHFTASDFADLAHDEQFVHVLIARHRPQSNGIAERFVRTLKEWLKNRSWHDDQDLTMLLEHFLTVYNNRPHQGISIPGLSPNEFANRIWLM